MDIEEAMNLIFALIWEQNPSEAGRTQLWSIYDALLEKARGA